MVGIQNQPRQLAQQPEEATQFQQVTGRKRIWNRNKKGWP